MYYRRCEEDTTEMINCSICQTPVEVFGNGYGQIMDGEITCSSCMNFEYDEFDCDFDEY